MCCRRKAAGKEGITMKKYCTKCGREFKAMGREVICPACKQAAAEDAKRAAVLKAKRASWAGESVPVRISGRASTVIRRYAAANGMLFAQALDDLLKASSFFHATGKAWEDVTPYKSRRRDKHATEDEQDTASKPQDGTQAAETTSKTSTAKKAVKTAAGKGGKKAKE